MNLFAPNPFATKPVQLKPGQLVTIFKTSIMVKVFSIDANVVTAELINDFVDPLPGGKFYPKGFQTKLLPNEVVLVN
jgi:hypothetical protein